MVIFKITRWPSILVFLLAGCVAIILAFVTANLFSYAMANVEFVRDFGFEALKNGAVVQIVELAFWGVLAMCCWYIFKVCEHILEDRYIAWSNKD
jgi:hypothetical protein